MRICFVFLVIILISFGFAYRLPNNVLPYQYNLNIITNLGDENDKYEFYGKVIIQTFVVEPTNNITLHSKNLNITEYEIKINCTEVLITSAHIDEENDFYTLVLNKTIATASHVEIHMKFYGALEDALAGYYRSSYVDIISKTRKYLAVTQFEANDARRAFPCFDEPEMKAKFKLSMGHKKKYIALANMNEIKQEPMKHKEDWIWTRFAETVPMSTYLVAFVVSDFGYQIADKTYSNVTFRIWARKDILNQVALAKNLGPSTLSFYEKFFNISYPLPKEDMIAIPDFFNNAMENWGLITYRETALLYDPEVTSITRKKFTYSVIAHELAHQWFGNLVTMKWWTDLWLNEGFATYMSTLAVEYLQPEWKFLCEESIKDLITVFDVDSLKTSHQISIPVGPPREIAEIFDTISYKKGSYILRMMSLFLGDKTFRQGVSKYLRSHSYGNAEQDDLWSSLTEAAHGNKVLPKELTVKTIMDTWTLKPGYPVIYVERNYINGRITIYQKRFLRDINATDPDNCSWWIPLTFTDSKLLQFNDTKPKYFLSNNGKPLIIEGPKGEKNFVLFNIEVEGLYRVNYDEDNWQLLVNYINSENFNNIPVVNRVQLILDSAAFGAVSNLTYNTFFEILKYLEMETEYLPWKAAINCLHELRDHLKRTSKYGILITYKRKLLGPAYNKFGQLSLAFSEGTNHTSMDNIELQAVIAKSACAAGVEECISDAQQLFNDYMNCPLTKPLPKNLRSIITSNAIREGGEEEWNFLWEIYLSTNVPTLKTDILESLGCTKESWLLQRYLEMSIDPNSGIRSQDFATVFASVATNEHGWYIARNFIQDKIEDIAKYLYPNGKRLSRCLTSLASQMINTLEYDWFETFTVKYEDIFKDAQLGVNQGLEIIKLNIQWQNMHEKKIGHIIAKYY